MYNSNVCRILVSLLFVGTAHIPAAFAEDSKIDKAKPSQPPVSQAVSESQSLNSLAHTFHQIHVSANRLKRICKSINDEFNRTSLKILTFDEYINQYIDGKPVAYNEQLYPYGFQNIGNTSTTEGEPLPARREYVTHFVTEANGLLSLVLHEIDDSAQILSSDIFDPSLAGMRKNLMDANASLTDSMKSLNDASEQNPYVKDAIVGACSDLSTKLTELESACKLTMKMASASRSKISK